MDPRLASPVHFTRARAAESEERGARARPRQPGDIVQIAESRRHRSPRRRTAEPLEGPLPPPPAPRAFIPFTPRRSPELARLSFSRWRLPPCLERVGRSRHARLHISLTRARPASRHAGRGWSIACVAGCVGSWRGGALRGLRSDESVGGAWWCMGAMRSVPLLLRVDGGFCLRGEWKIDISVVFKSVVRGCMTTLWIEEFILVWRSILHYQHQESSPLVEVLYFIASVLHERGL